MIGPVPLSLEQKAVLALVHFGAIGIPQSCDVTQLTLQRMTPALRIVVLNVLDLIVEANATTRRLYTFPGLVTTLTGSVSSSDGHCMPIV